MEINCKKWDFLKKLLLKKKLIENIFFFLKKYNLYGKKKFFWFNIKTLSKKKKF